MTKEQKEKLLEYFGTQAALARILGLDRQVINQWFTDRRLIPFKYIYVIHTITRGKVKMSDLLEERDKCYPKNTKTIKE